MVANVSPTPDVRPTSAPSRTEPRSVHLHTPRGRFPQSSTLNGSACLILKADHRGYGVAFVFSIRHPNVSACSDRIDGRFILVDITQVFSLKKKFDDLDVLGSSEALSRMPWNRSAAPARRMWMWDVICVKGLISDRESCVIGDPGSNTHCRSPEELMWGFLKWLRGAKLRRWMGRKKVSTPHCVSKVVSVCSLQREIET